MSVEQMTHVSYFFMILSGVFGAAAAVMYFTCDIRRCWQIVRSGRLPKSFRAQDVTVCAQSEKTQKLAGEEPTELLGAEDTLPLGTMKLLQDITFMQ